MGGITAATICVDGIYLYCDKKKLVIPLPSAGRDNNIGATSSAAIEPAGDVEIGVASADVEIRPKTRTKYPNNVFAIHPPE